MTDYSKRGPRFRQEQFEELSARWRHPSNQLNRQLPERHLRHLQAYLLETLDREHHLPATILDHLQRLEADLRQRDEALLPIFHDTLKTVQVNHFFQPQRSESSYTAYDNLQSYKQTNSS